MRDDSRLRRWLRRFRRAAGGDAAEALARAEADAELTDELSFHLESRVREHEARGLDPEAARAAALERLGDLERVRRERAGLHRSAARSEARRVRLRVPLLDIELGFRRLVKYPGLTVVGGLVMSFAVARRPREIGVRVALGADARRIVAAIFRRPLTQVALGVLAGGGLTAALSWTIHGGALSATHAALVAVYAALMLGICLLACVVPTLRALRVEPTEALRAEG